MFKTPIMRFVRPVALTALLLAAVVIVARPTLPVAQASAAPRPAGQAPLVGDGPNRAGVAVKFGDGRVESRCVAFSEQNIGGDELLQRSGLVPAISPEGAVCSIGGEGCPTDNCFCQCENFQDCQYWAYYQWQGDSWVYSQFGVTASTVSASNGDLQAWSWGAGDSITGAPPPDVKYDDLCRGPIEDATATFTPEGQTANATAVPQVTFSVTPVRVTPVASPSRQASATTRVTLPASAQRPIITQAPGGLATAALPGTLEGGVPSAPTAQLLVLATQAPEATATPYRFSLPPTETPRPRRAIGADGGPTPTPLLIAQAAGASGAAPVAKVGANSLGGLDGRRQLVESRAFSPQLLPGYAAYVAMIAGLLAMGWYALRRRNARPNASLLQPEDGAEGAPRSARKE